MSSTIGDLVDRIYREYLEPMDSVESYSYLTGDVTTTTQSTINYEEGMFSTEEEDACLLYTSPSPRDKRQSRMPSSA